MRCDPGAMRAEWAGVRSQDAAIERVVAATRDRVGDHPALSGVLDGLTGLLHDVSTQWSLVLGEVYTEGIGAPVIAVEAAGEPSVLKIDRPGAALAAQVATLTAAGGRGYAVVLAADVGRGAVLMERLGPSLASRHLPPQEQLDHLAATLRLAWEVPVPATPAGVAETGGAFDKADQLSGIVQRFRTPDDEARWGPALDRADELARHLSASRGGIPIVWCHGDPHQGNALQSKGIPRFKFVDPDGFGCEAEYDVGVTLRDFSRELLARDAPRARAWHDGLCEQAAVATGTDVQRVRQWAFVERVTTGLYLRWFRDDETAETFLDSAMALTPAT